MRSRASALLLGCLFVCGACSKGATTPPPAGDCTRNRDCQQNPVHVCQTGKCILVCSTDLDCGSTGQVCENGSCVAPGCGGNADCTGGQVCQGGNCVQPPSSSSVASCDVIPSHGVLNAASTTSLHAYAKDATGASILFNGFIWTATGSATVDANTGVVTGSGVTGTAIITAKAGSTTCATSAIQTYAAAAGGTRVVVIDALTKQPIAGAFVVIDTVANKHTTGADGSYSSTLAAGPHDIHVFAAGYNYASFLSVTGTDLLVPLQPYVVPTTRSGFSGTMNAADFSTLSEQGQIVHLAFFGSSIPNSPLDLSVDTLIGGAGRDVTVSFTGTPTTLHGMPYGLVLGLGADTFMTENYRVFADAGSRALWGFGGNIDFSTVLAVATSAGLGGSGGTTVDPSKLLPQILPLLNKLQMGALVDQVAPVTTSGGVATFNQVTIPLNTLLRLRATADVPTLPTVDGKYVDGTIALVGAGAYPMGFLPLGFTAGIAYKDANGTETGAVLDPSCTRTSATGIECATSRLPLNFAAENGGTEGSPYGYLLVALNYSALTHGTNGGIGGVAVSGLVNTQPSAHYVAPSATAPEINYGTNAKFLGLPGSAQISATRSNRTITIHGDADASPQLYRFELESAARLNWQVWMAPIGSPSTARTITLIDPSQVDASLIDPMADSVPSVGKPPAGPSGRLTGLQLGPSATYGGLTSFGSQTLDQIGNSLTAFNLAFVAIN